MDFNNNGCPQDVYNTLVTQFDLVHCTVYIHGHLKILFANIQILTLFMILRHCFFVCVIGPKSTAKYNIAFCRDPSTHHLDG